VTSRHNICLYVRSPNIRATKIESASSNASNISSRTKRHYV